MNKLPKQLKRQVQIWWISGLALIVFLVGVEPLKLPLTLLLIPFIIFAIWVRAGAIVVGMAIRHQSKPSRKVKVIASSLAAILLLVVTLMSLGQLSWRDILLVGSLVIGLMFYFYKTDLF
jgi:hypothetical protein